MAVREPILLPSDLKKIYPLSCEEESFVSLSRSAVRDILDGKDDRFLIIVGPCSIHDVNAAEEYARRIAALQEKVKDNLLLVMRVYYEKSRTSTGWQGLASDPHLDDSYDIAHGLTATRRLLHAIVQNGVITAAELLEPLSINYFSDLISWGCIGARTATSHTHRQLAAMMPFPMGIKNSVDGNISNAVNGVKVAMKRQSFLSMDDNGRIVVCRAEGNDHAHVVLRGAERYSNNDLETIRETERLFVSSGLTPCLLIDCSHGNSGRKASNQSEQLRKTIGYVKEGVRSVRGALLESHLHQGQQCMNTTEPLAYGVSITDECIGWEETEALIYEASEALHLSLQL